MIDIEAAAKVAVGMAVPIVRSANPIAGIVFEWAAAVAFEIIDDVRAKADPVLAAQKAGDRVVDLVEALKVGA